MRVLTIRVGAAAPNAQIKKMIPAMGENADLSGSFSRRVGGGSARRHAGRAMRAAARNPGFYTRTGVGTLVQRARSTRSSTELLHLERGIFADLALVKAWKAISMATSSIAHCAHFNPAQLPAEITVAEAEIVAEPGEIDPDEIHTPGIFVHRLCIIPS